MLFLKSVGSLETTNDIEYEMLVSTSTVLFADISLTWFDWTGPTGRCERRRSFPWSVAVRFSWTCRPDICEDMCRADRPTREVSPSNWCPLCWTLFRCFPSIRSRRAFSPRTTGKNHNESITMVRSVCVFFRPDYYYYYYF